MLRDKVQKVVAKPTLLSYMNVYSASTPNLSLPAASSITRTLYISDIQVQIAGGQQIRSKPKDTIIATLAEPIQLAVYL